MGATQNVATVDLGAMRQGVEDRIKAGAYGSADEVIQAGLLALKREEKGTNEWLMQLAEESLVDPRPSIPAAQVFRDVRSKYGRPLGEIESSRTMRSGF